MRIHTFNMFRFAAHHIPIYVTSAAFCVPVGIVIFTARFSSFRDETGNGGVFSKFHYKESRNEKKKNTNQHT